MSDNPWGVAYHVDGEPEAKPTPTAKPDGGKPEKQVSAPVGLVLTFPDDVLKGIKALVEALEENTKAVNQLIKTAIPSASSRDM